MRRVLSFAALSLIAIASTASAQRTTRSSSMASANPSPEIGVDGALIFGLDDPNTTTLSLPVQRIRVGFFLSPTISIEPTFGLTTISGGGDRMTTYTIGTGLLWHFAPSRAANQLYVRPFLDFNGASLSGAGSDNSVTFGAGFGIKHPIRDRFNTRLEGLFGHTGEHSGVPSSNELGILFGFSVYTR